MPSQVRQKIEYMITKKELLTINRSLLHLGGTLWSVVGYFLVQSTLLLLRAKHISLDYCAFATLQVPDSI